MRITGAFAATLAVALLAGCGSPAPSAPSGPASSPPPAVTSAPAATDPAPSPSETSAAPGGSELSVDDFLQRVSGAKLKTYTMDMEMSMTIEGQQVAFTTSGSFDATDPADPNSHMKMNIGGVEMEMILLDGAAFMKAAAAGDQWMKVDPKDAAEMGGTSGSEIGQWTEDYAKNVEKVELVGDEDLNGLTVTRYRLTMKPGALDNLGMEDVEITATGVVFDVWVDGDGFTRKFAMDMDGDVPVAMTATLNDINEPVTIEAPEDWVEMPS